MGSRATYSTGQMLAGRYRVLSSIGAGGMGEVYKVEDTALENQHLALKVLLSHAEGMDPSATARFRNEVLITRRLSHTNLVRTFDFGVVDGNRTFMTMEFISGQTLHELIAEGTFQRTGMPAIIRLLGAMADAVGYAHRHGVIHRDLKTANVLISDDGEVKITDFGLAQSQDNIRRFTMTGECIGTPTYMSPEQVQGLPVDRRSDIYALGIIAYELVTGRVPFKDPSWMNLASMIVKDPVPQIQNTLFEVPQWYRDMIAKATAKKPEARFQSAEEMLKLLRMNSGMDTSQFEMKETMRLILPPKNKWGSKPAIACALGFLLLAVGAAAFIRRPDSVPQKAVAVAPAAPADTQP